jgi:uncharacterized coiled-coil DUF342 family protein
MKHTLIETLHDEAQHAYLVTIGTDMGQFTGAVECREEDWNHESRYLGFELAEIKAEIQYARAKRNHYNAQLKALTQFWRDMTTTRTYDQDAFWVKQMRKRVDDINWQEEFWDNRIKHLKECYHIKILAFDSLNKTRNRCEEYNND